MREKARAALEQGFNYKLWVISPKGDYIKVPKDWYNMTRVQVRKYVKEHI